MEGEDVEEGEVEKGGDDDADAQLWSRSKYRSTPQLQIRVRGARVARRGRLNAGKCEARPADRR